ncbi:MAG: diguanylate cyclase [Pseudomonadales bacterium]|nr:diguanylate cyclase [Pseudomonadales bacterium]
MKLKEIMSPASVFYSPDDSLLAVAESLAEKHHSCGLICEFDKPMGIITERDIVRLFASQAGGEELTNLPVKEVMTHQPICIESETELSEAMELARSRNLRHLPIVDATQKLIGVVTLTDMVKAYLETIEKNKTLEDENHKLHVLSIEDPLTGLPNRRAMEIDVRHAAAVSQRRSEPYSIAMVDLDYFKKFNDHYGHQAGDDALIHVAHALRNSKRESDKLFRYGGEEFLLLMPFTQIEGAVIAARRLSKAVSSTRYDHSESPFGFLTVSIGVACNNNEYWEAVVEQADSALYDAKEKGRNTVCLVEPAPETEFWDLSQKSESTEPEPKRPAPN